MFSGTAKSIPEHGPSAASSAHGRGVGELLEIEVVVRSLLMKKDGHPDRAPTATAEENEAIKERTQRILAARAHLKTILVKNKPNGK